MSIYKIENKYYKSILEACKAYNLSLMVFLKWMIDNIIEELKLLPRQGKEERIYLERLKQLMPEEKIIPQYRFVLRSMGGDEYFYFDIYFPEHRLVVEFNEPYHASPEQREKDVRKREVVTKYMKCNLRVATPENLRKMESLM